MKELKGMDPRLRGDDIIDLPIEPAPFETVAKKIGISEDDLILEIMKSLDSGEIRRFGAALNHNNAGYRYNVLLVWSVPEDKIDEAGAKVAESKAVSHCYRREPVPDWPYNLYAMMHAKSEDEGRQIIDRLKEIVYNTAPDNEFRKLKTIKEFKKTSFIPK